MPDGQGPSPNVKANVLLVDDEPRNLLALEAILADQGHNLITADSGEDALRLLREHDIAVVLLDVHMSGLDGFDTAKQIRSQQKSRHTPIIFLTAYEDPRFPVDKAYELGAVDYLVTPLIPVILRAKVGGFVELFNKTEQVKQQAERLRQAQRSEFEGKLAEESLRGHAQRAEALLESEEQFRKLANSIPNLTWMARPDGYIFWYNERWYEYTGTTPEQMVGWGWQTVHDPMELPKVLEAWKASIATGKVFQMVFPLRSAQGKYRSFLTRVMPLRDRTGAIVNWFGTNTDVTEIAEMEAALRQADRHKDEFLAMLAHELRNPLAPIRNALHVLTMSPTNDEIARQAITMMGRQVNNLVRLVDDLLDVSRITRGKIGLRKERLDLAGVIQRAVETSRPLIDARGHALSIHLPQEPVFLEADATRLEQIIANLLNNAAKYTERGGCIWLSGGREDGAAVIRVRDSGIGIATELMLRLFNLFTQAERSLDRTQGGLGIGLALVKSLVEMHGGHVTAHSDGPGKGSEFVICLPVLAG